MSVSEIIAELPRLDVSDLALIEAKLRAVKGNSPRPSRVRILTPRLACPEQAADFVKQVVEAG
jgi:hypothetical protein